MYVERFDALLSWLELEFPAMKITGSLKDIDDRANDNPLQLRDGYCTLVMGPGHSFNDLLGQDPMGRQVLNLVVQKTESENSKGEQVQRAELALMDVLRKLQNSQHLPPQASGLMLRDIVPSQQSRAPKLEIIATFEVQDYD